MYDHQTRLDALRKGITRSSDNGYVAILVADLRWLLDQIEQRVPEPPTDGDFEGELDEPDHE